MMFIEQSMSCCVGVKVTEYDKSKMFVEGSKNELNEGSFLLVTTVLPVVVVVVVILPVVVLPVVVLPVVVVVLLPLLALLPLALLLPALPLLSVRGVVGGDELIYNLFYKINYTNIIVNSN
jgi:hypothetical protein